MNFNEISYDQHAAKDRPTFVWKNMKCLLRYYF